jgi:hypothetical protein
MAGFTYHGVGYALSAAFLVLGAWVRFGQGDLAASLIYFGLGLATYHVARTAHLQTGWERTLTALREELAAKDREIQRLRAELAAEE